LCSVNLRAQSTYGALTGVVVDASGAAEVGATVTLTNVGTSDKQVQATGETGLYSFVNLYPGQYRVTVDKTGFKRVDRQNVTVLVQQTTRLDIGMSVGAASETVTVTSDVPLLQAETSSLGQVVEERNADELPLNGRNVFSLVEVSPSVVMQGQAGSAATTVNPFAWGNFQIGGAFANQSAEYLDGQPLNIGYVNLPVVIPTQDTIGEFKVQTNNIGPEWGKVAGGVLNLSTKSGSNHFHGEAYEYIRNKVLNANDWFSNNDHLGRPPFTQNQFGANTGGRVFKDRTFFFYSYEGFRLRQGVTYTGTVPTAAVRSEIAANAAGTPTDIDLGAGNTGYAGQLYDPCAGNYNHYGSGAGGTNVFGDGGCAGTAPSPYSTTKFKNNIIPAARVNMTDAKLFMRAYPAANNGAGLTSNYANNYGAGGNQNQNVVRIDQRITDKQHIFGRFTQWNNLNQPTDPLGTGFCSDRCQETMLSKTLATGYNYVFTSNVIGNLDVSASRFKYVRLPVNSGYDLTGVDWPASFNSEVPSGDRTPPTAFILGYVGDVMSSLGAGSFIQDADTQAWISPYLTIVHGRHTIQAGLQYELSQDNYAQTNTASGTFGFNGSYTADYSQANPTEFALADYILGYAQNPSNITNHFYGAAQNVSFIAGRQYVYAGYFNDTYHATGKLVLNLGIRYELQTPWTERFNRYVDFNPTEQNPYATQAMGVSMLGNVDLVDTVGNPSRNSLNPNHKGVAPRFGFAYSIDPKTVIRGGYGLFWTSIDTNWATNPLNDPTNSAETEYTGNESNTKFPINTMSTPWASFIEPPGRTMCAGSNCPVPTGSTLAPAGSEAGWQLEGQSVAGISVRDFKYPYSQQWNLDVQRTLWGGFFADLAYAGNKGTHLPQYAQQVNQIADSYLAQAATQAGDLTGYPNGPAITQTVTNPFANYSYPGSALSQPTTNAGQLLRPFPQYTTLEYAGQGSFASIYHSLQATLQKRFSGGGTLLAAYTWAKLESNTDTITSWLEQGGEGGVQDWNNLRGEKSLSSQDVRQHLIVSYVLDLPLGRNKRFLNNWSGPADKIVDGWGIDGVTTFMDGFPVNVTTAIANGTSNWGGGLRPMVVSGVSKKGAGGADQRVKSGLAGGEGWINPAAFSQPAPYTFGNETRVDSSLRTQGIDNWDLAIFKRTPIIKEKVAFEFRTELFNTFNHVQFGPPNNAYSPAGPPFGQVTNQFNSPRLVQFAGKFVF
jgi:hypothetical protein